MYTIVRAERIKDNLVQYIYGAGVFAVVAGILACLASYAPVALQRWKTRRQS